MNDVKFSIVVPLYNKEKSIHKTVNSVLNQTHSNFELIIVNDGSTDNSLKVVEIIKDDRIRIINKKNGGVSSARNKGVDEAKNTWIAFLDGDDIWQPYHLQEVTKLMALFPKASVYSTSFIQSNHIVSPELDNNSESFLVKDYFKESLKSAVICSSAVVVNKDCFNEVGYFDTDLSMGEDLHMWLRLALNFQIAKSHRITAIYVQEAENRSSGVKDAYDDLLLYKIISVYKDSTKNNYFKKYIEKLIIRETKRCLLLGKNLLVLRKLNEYNHYFANKLSLLLYFFLALLPVKTIYSFFK